MAYPSIGVYIIHLRRREDRLPAVQKLELAFKANTEIGVYVIDAIDGKNPDVVLPNAWKSWKLTTDAIGKLQFDDRKARETATRMWTKDLKPGEVGCACSHSMVWKKATERNHEHVLVFEDDAEYDEKLDLVKLLFTTVFNKNIEFHILRLVNTDWDPRGSTKKRDRKRQSGFVDLGPTCSPLVVGSTSWTGAYVLSRKGCALLSGSDLEADYNTINVDDFLYALSLDHPRRDLLDAPPVKKIVSKHTWINLRSADTIPIWGAFNLSVASDKGDCFTADWHITRQTRTGVP